MLQTLPATYQEEEHLFRSMRKEVMFNVTLQHTDGLLSESYMQTYGVDYRKAQLMLEEDIEALNVSLEQDKRITLGRIGTFSIGEEGQTIFTPGDSGFRVWNTRYGCIGVGICWDQWFPETARCMALQGAELLFYPTAIGSEPLLGMDSSGHWQRCMQGHAAANLMPVIAANRIGTETVEPCEANQNQQSELTFYGTSFITDQTGAVLEQAGRTEDTVLLHTFDLDAIQKDRLEWGLFRDRRPEQYGAISSPIPVQI